MIEFPNDFWFYLPDTTPVSAIAPQPFPTWARQRPPPWRFVGWLRRAAVGPGEYPQLQADALTAEPGESRERDDDAEGVIVGPGRAEGVGRAAPTLASGGAARRFEGQAGRHPSAEMARCYR